MVVGCYGVVVEERKVEVGWRGLGSYQVGGIVTMLKESLIVA